MIFVMFGISVMVFLIFFATPGADPGGPHRRPQRLARGAGRRCATISASTARCVQYPLLMKRLFVTGDLTTFVNRGQKVIPAIIEAMPATLSLVFGAAVFWVVVRHR